MNDNKERFEMTIWKNDLKQKKSKNDLKQKNSKNDLKQKNSKNDLKELWVNLFLAVF